MRSFYQDRLGTNIGKALKSHHRFLSQVAADPSYYSKAAHDSDDFIRQGMEHDSAFNETTFSAAASRLPPPHDYAIVGKKIIDLISVHSVS